MKEPRNNKKYWLPGRSRQEFHSIYEQRAFNILRSFLQYITTRIQYMNEFLSIYERLAFIT